MKSYFIILAFVFSISLKGQKPFVIDIDSMKYNKHGTISLINYGETTNYNCEIYANRKRDFDYNFSVGCQKLKGDDLYTEGIRFRRFNSDLDFNTWLVGKTFWKSSDYKQGEQIINIKSLLKIHNKNYGLIIEYKKTGTTGSWKEINSYPVYILRFKFSKNYFANVFEIEQCDTQTDCMPDYIDELEIENFVIPFGFEKDSINDSYFRATTETISEIEYFGQNIFHTYRILKLDDKKILCNAISARPLIKQKLDSINLSYPFVIGIDRGKLYIYNWKLEKFNTKKLKGIKKQLEFLQIIYDNEIKWLDENLTIHDSIPNSKLNWCGTADHYTRQIHQHENSFFETKQKSFTLSKDKINIDTIKIIENNADIVDLKFLDKSIFRNESILSYGGLFNFSQQTYYFTKKDGSEGLMVTTNLWDKARNKIVRNNNLSFDRKEELLRLIDKKLKEKFENEIIFVGKFDEFKLTNYNKLIKFRIGNLWGYFPACQTAKYIHLGEFIGHFASFKKENGETGWIDLEGNEYIR